MVLLPLGFLLIQGLRARGAIVLRRRERRRVQHQRSLRCPGCGYDLRGSVFGERCPECGTMLT
ncbi:MAG: hypothetical protein FJ253_01210 [Phycisphaerae bacterium]|nr:hypothetical protein [Phycisphaerae bacterium]